MFLVLARRNFPSSRSLRNRLTWGAESSSVAATVNGTRILPRSRVCVSSGHPF